MWKKAGMVVWIAATTVVAVLDWLIDLPVRVEEGIPAWRRWAQATDEWWAAWRHRWGDLSAYPAHSGTCPTGRPNVSPNSPHVGSDRGVVGCSLSSCDYPCRRLNFPKRVIVPADADAPPAGPVAVRRVQPVPRRFEVARAARRRRGRRVCGAGATRDPAAPRVRIPSVRRTRRGAGRSGPGRAG